MYVKSAIHSWLTAVSFIRLAKFRYTSRSCRESVVMTKRRCRMASKLSSPIHRTTRLWLTLQTPPPQLGPDATVTVAAVMSQCNLLNSGADFHVFFLRMLLPQRPIISGTAHFRQPTHLFHAQFALRWDSHSDFGIDARSPSAPLAGRSRFTLRKAATKKSTSAAFSPNVSFSSLFSR